MRIGFGALVTVLALSACGSTIGPDAQDTARKERQPPKVGTFFPDELAKEDFETPLSDPISCIFQVPWPAAPDSNDVTHVSMTRMVLRALGKRHELLPIDDIPSLTGVPEMFADKTYSARLTLRAKQTVPDSLGNRIRPANLSVQDPWMREVYAGNGALICNH
jgi:hypothetical protein